MIYLKDSPARSVRRGRTAIRQKGETFLPRVVAVAGAPRWLPQRRPTTTTSSPLSRARTFTWAAFRAASRAPCASTSGHRQGVLRHPSHMAASVIVFNHPGSRCPMPGQLRARRSAGGRPQITALHDRLGDTPMRVRMSQAAPPPWSSCFRYRRSEAPAAAGDPHDGRDVHHGGRHPDGGLHGAAGDARDRVRAAEADKLQVGEPPSRVSEAHAPARSRWWPSPSCRRTPPEGGARHLLHRARQCASKGGGDARDGVLQETVAREVQRLSSIIGANVSAALDAEGRVFASRGAAAARWPAGLQVRLTANSATSGVAIVPLGAFRFSTRRCSTAIAPWGRWRWPQPRHRLRRGPEPAGGRRDRHHRQRRGGGGHVGDASHRARSSPRRASCAGRCRSAARVRHPPLMAPARWGCTCCRRSTPWRGAPRAARSSRWHHRAVGVRARGICQLVAGVAR